MSSSVLDMSMSLDGYIADPNASDAIARRAQSSRSVLRADAPFPMKAALLRRLNLKRGPQRQQVATIRRRSLRLGSHDRYTLEGQWELSTDHSTWNDDLKIAYCRVGS
jgi:hypothetical protein